ncbi:MAG: PilZ domain-containing protein [Desulfobacterales bacterium]
MPKTTSRRNHRRFKVKDGAFAVLFQDSSKLAEIIDISMTGFAFRYSDSAFIDNDRDGRAFLYQDCQNRLDHFSSFDIFLVDSGIYLDRIPCKIISHVEIDGPESPNSIPMKRCGIAFAKLLPEQISDLEYFIKNCTQTSR